MDKDEIRKEYLEKRNLISEAEYIYNCQQICDQFFTFFDLSFAKTLHTFLPIKANHEPDTWLIVDRVRREFPNVRLSIPRVNKITDSLENFYFEGLHQLQENRWGIKEPKQGVPTETHNIDMVLVPLLAFDLAGQRIGYGKGYYDRFLATCGKDCKKIGLSLLPPLQKLPAEAQDVPLNWCITPAKVYQFQL